MASDLEMQEAEDAIDRHRVRIAELEAEIERLRRLVMAQSRTIHSPEALSRTGAVKVKALEWEALPSKGRYIAIAPLVGRYVADSHPGSGTPGWKAPGVDEDWQLTETLDEAKAAAQADYERRILSALEPAAPESAGTMLSNLLARIHRDGGHYEAMNGTEKAVADADDIVARIYANQPAAPEGQQAPVAEFGNGEVLVDTGTFWGRPAVFVRPAPAPGPVGQLAPAAIRAEGLREILPGEWFITFPTDEQACAVADALVGRFTRPSGQAVTEAMVEAAIAAMFHGHGWFPPPYAMRAALKAAMEAGRYD